MDAASTLTRNFNLQIGNYTISPTYWQAGAIIFLIFLLVITLASVRRHLLEWSVKGAGFGIVLGFVLALIVEAFLLLGGRTAFTEIIAWEHAPKPIAAALQASRSKLVNVLGVTDEVPNSNAAEQLTVDLVIQQLQSLPEEEINQVKQLLCDPVR